jgi:serine/threonine protein kinase
LKELSSVRTLASVNETKDTVLLSYSAPPQSRSNQGEITLLEYTKRAGKLDEEEAKIIFAQVATALALCHDRYVVHRDLKLPSVLIDPLTKHVRLADFSHSTTLNSGDELVTDRRGSPAYIGPEVVIGQPYRGEIADCWSLGVLLYAMLCGAFPFVGSTPMLLFEKIVKAELTFPEDLSPEACSLIRGLLKPAPSGRLTAFEALDHPWLEVSCDEDQMVPEMD